MKTPSLRGWTVLLAGLLLIAGASLAALNQKEIARLRVEQAALASDRQEAQRLTQENGEIDRLRTEAAEAKNLRAEIESLLALRNEVTQLMRQTNALAGLQSEHERLLAQSKALPGPSSRTAPASPPPGFISKADLRNVGLSSPEAALQTYYWAMREGNLEALTRCEVNGERNRNGDREYELRQLAERMGAFNGYFVAGRQQTSEIAITLIVQGTVNGAAISVSLKLVANEWKIDR